MPTFAEALNKISEREFFIKSSQEVLDFTSNKPVSLILFSDDLKLDIPLSNDLKKIKEICGILKASIGCPTCVVIGWNLKNIFSYILAKTKIPLNFEGKIFDLQILENYVGLNNQPPETLDEAKKRLNFIFKHKSWKELKDIYKKIYLPLITKVVPDIETIGIIHNKTKLYAHYDIAAQANGRMRCAASFLKSYNPHTLSEDKTFLKPPFFDHEFLYLDYKHIEPTVLQWLSDDPLLGQILDSGADLYEAIWTELTTLPCSKEHRAKCKNIFLPVVYGQGVEAVSTRNNISLNTAKKLVERIYTKFSTALSWVHAQKNYINDGVAKDVFERCRNIPEEYLVYCFSVQSPTALLCLEKLVYLHDNLNKIAFHVHDGYALYVPKLETKKIAEKAVELLQNESGLFPGLKLKVTVSYGPALDQLVIL